MADYDTTIRVRTTVDNSELETTDEMTKKLTGELDKAKKKLEEINSKEVRNTSELKAAKAEVEKWTDALKGWKAIEKINVKGARDQKEPKQEQPEPESVGDESEEGKKLSEIKGKIEETLDSVEKAKEKVRDLEWAGNTDSDEYREAINTVKQYNAELDNLIQKRRELEGTPSNVSSEKSIGDIKKGLDNAKTKVKDLEKMGAVNTDAYKQAKADVDKWTAALEKNAKTQKEAAGVSDGDHESTSSSNDMRADVEKYAESLKELESQGKYFGDEDYDKVYVKWKNATDAVKEYAKALDATTVKGQEAAKAQQEAAAKKQAAQQEAAWKKKLEAAQKQNAQAAKDAQRQIAQKVKDAQRQAAQEEKEAQRQEKIAQKVEKKRQEEEKLRQIKANAQVSDQKLVDLLKEQEQIQKRLAELKKAGVTDGYKEYDALSAKLAKIKDQIKAQKDGFSKMGDNAKKAMKKVSDGAKKSSGFMKTFARRLKGIALSLLVFNWITKAFNAMISGMKEGFNNLVQYSDECNKSMSQLKSAGTQLKNALATAFTPIIQTAVPYLVTLINYITAAANKVAEFAALIAGKSTWTKAKAVQEDYAASLDNTAKSAEETSKSLAGFDKLNVLSQDKSSGSSSGTTSPGDMFEEVAVSDEANDKLDKIKNALASLFNPMKESWDINGSAVVESAKGMLSSILNLCTDIGHSFSEIWNNGTGLRICNDLLGILINVMDTVRNIADAFDEAWNFEGTGNAIIQSLLDILLNVLDAIYEISAATEEWSAELDLTPLLTSFSGLLDSLEPLTSTVCDGLVWMYENVLLPFASWSIEDAIPAFFDLLAAALDVVNAVLETFKPLGQWLWDSFLSPLASWTGDAIVGALQTLSDLLTKIGDWVTDHQTLLENLAIIIGSVAAAIEIVNVAMTAYNVLAAVYAAVTAAGGVAALASSVAATALGAAIAFLTSPITLAVAAIAAIIAICVLLCKNWDTVKEKAAAVWTEIKNTISDADDWVYAHFGEFIEYIKDTVNGIIEIFCGIVTFLKGVFTEDWGMAWDGITQIIEGVKDTIKGIINQIICIVEAMANGIVDGINAIIRALNNLQIDAPDWVTDLTGISSFGFNIAERSHISIPRLADGAVIRGGSSFAAILGDQPAGQTNIETPLPTMVKAFKQAMAETGGEYTFVAQLDGKEIFRETVRQEQMYRKATGRSVFV